MPTATSLPSAHVTAQEWTRSSGIGAYGVGGTNLSQPRVHARGRLSGLASGIKNSISVESHIATRHKRDARSVADMHIIGQPILTFRGSIDQIAVLHDKG